MQIAGLLQLDKLCNDIFRSDDPGEANSRRQCFREGAEIDHIPQRKSVIATQVLSIKYEERRNVLAFVAKLAIGIIFDDRNTVFVRKENELVAAAFGQSD